MTEKIPRLRKERLERLSLRTLRIGFATFAVNSIYLQCRSKFSHPYYGFRNLPHFDSPVP